MHISWCHGYLDTSVGCGDKCCVMQVTTIRSSSRKPEIPLVSDSVSKLQSIGKETVAKLKDIHAAALASPNPGDASTLQDFTQHTNSVTTGRCHSQGSADHCFICGLHSLEGASANTHSSTAFLQVIVKHLRVFTLAPSACCFIQPYIVCCS